MGIAKEVKPTLRLTALHLVGFKSFADKVELRFGPGVTAIVGPNGSGKSNVVDAVRWVLGEQNSRALRSDRVTNLIFAGTERRKPLGLAQATIALDNSDQTAPIEFNELNIVRRVFRSGESEFLLNGTPCRLRDIQQLLLGTGLGRGGMAVVGQGEIDAILSARPADRRLLLEETAGTSRFRAQQRTAEQRLERARQDLARVRDLIVELEARVDTLTVQAEVAARYKRITAELQQQRATRAARDWVRARERQHAARQQLAAEREQLMALEKRGEAAERTALEARGALERNTEQLEKARTALREAEATLGQRSHRLQLLQLQWQAAEERRLRAVEEFQLRQGDERKAEQSVHALDNEIARETEQIEALRSSMEKVSARLAAFEARYKDEVARTTGLREELMQLLQTTGRQRNELHQLEEEQRTAATRQEEAEQMRRDLEKDVERAREEFNRARAEVEAGERRMKQGEEEDRRLAEKLKRARERLAEVARQRAEVESRRQETEATRRALERLEKTYAGYRPAVKAVLGASPALPGVLGTVGQLIDVPERFELPVQVALGAATQFIVMADESSVLQAIASLRRQRAGRATFLSLDAVRPRAWPRDADALLQQTGVLGRVTDVIRFDEDVAPVIQYLLGRVAIVEQLARAQQLARNLNPGVRLVTMQGDLLTPGGPVTGGFQSNQAVDGTLSRRRELRKLTRRLEELQQRLQQLTRSMDEANGEVEEVEARIARRRSTMTADAIERAKQHQQALQIDAERERLETALRKLQAEEVERAKREEFVAARREKLEQLLRQAEQKENDLRSELASMSEQAERGETERRTLADEVAEGRAALAAREEALRGLHRRRGDAKEECSRAGAEARRFDEMSRRARKEQERLQDEIDELQSTLPELNEHIETQRDAVALAVDMQAKSRTDLEQAEAEVRAGASAVAEAKEKVWTTEAALARHESAVEGYAQRLRELDVADAEAERIADRDDLPRGSVRALEEELEALGPVHLGAEAELHEIDERLQFLQEQRHDLEEAGLSLEEVIQRLDKLSEERFADTLDKVAREFEIIFRRLFGGGHARLAMSEGEDGVDVHVQMPGKRTQNLLALSGGERALTAIALLFAILRVQPSPFYVLDEIDSALDEANLARFQTMLREASKEAQFIVITHRATTMEVADTLYGVTASEPGVSTVISLDLQAAMETIA